MKDIGTLLNQILDELKRQGYTIHRLENVPDASIEIAVYKPETFSLPWEALKDVQKKLDGVCTHLKDKTPIEKLRFLAKGKLEKFAAGDYNVK